MSSSTLALIADPHDLPLDVAEDCRDLANPADQIAASARRRGYGSWKGKVLESSDCWEPDFTDEDYEAWMSKL